MINLAAPTLPNPGGAIADLLSQGGVVSAQNGGFADLLALQSGPVPGETSASTLAADTLSSLQPAIEPARALPATGKILPPAVAAAGNLVSASDVSLTALVAAPVVADMIRAVAVPLAKPAHDAAEPAAEAQPAPTPVFLTLPALRQQIALPAAKAALREEPQAGEAAAEEAEAETTPETQAIAEAPAARLLSFELVAAPLLQLVVVKAGAETAQAAPVAAAAQAVAPLPVVMEQPKAQTQPAVEQLDAAAAAPVTTANAKPEVRGLSLNVSAEAAPGQTLAQPVAQPIRIAPVEAQAVAAPLAMVLDEAPTPVMPTVQRLKAAPVRLEQVAIAANQPEAPVQPQARQRVEPAVVVAEAPAAPLAAAPQVIEADVRPVTVATAPKAERPVEFTELVDRLTTAREMASPDRVQVAVNHAEFGKVSLRFEADSAGLNVAMSSADPDFARAVAAAAPAQQFAGSSDAAPQRSASDQFAASGQTPSQQQNAPQQSRAEARSAERVMARNPSPDDGDEQAPARRGLFA